MPRSCCWGRERTRDNKLSHLFRKAKRAVSNGDGLSCPKKKITRISIKYPNRKLIAGYDTRTDAESGCG